MESQNNNNNQPSPAATRFSPDMLRDYALTLATARVEERVSKNQLPHCVLLRELEAVAVEDFREALRSLCRDKLLVARLNLNKQPMFELPDSPESEP